MSFKIGFTAGTEENKVADEVIPAINRTTQVKKSLVRVHFAERNLTCTYYNDMFDLSVGDIVYVDGKLEGLRGRVVEVSYSFKIKLSDYKRVIAVADTNVSGEFHFAASHLFTLDKNALPFSKVLTWFKAPADDDEYEISTNNSEFIVLDNLNTMNITPEIAKRGNDYYLQNRVVYIEIDNTKGRAIVEGGNPYTVEFNYKNGEVTNLTCDCFCAGHCKHEFATMLQLRETLNIAKENYDIDCKADYIAIISKPAFYENAFDNKTLGSFTVG